MKGQVGITLTLPADLHPINKGPFKSRVLHAATGNEGVVENAKKISSLANEGPRLTHGQIMKQNLRRSHVFCEFGYR